MVDQEWWSVAILNRIVKMGFLRKCYLNRNVKESWAYPCGYLLEEHAMQMEQKMQTP